MGEPSRRRPKNHVWPPEAARIAQKKLSAVALCEQLMAMTGQPSWLYYRSAARNGVHLFWRRAQYSASGGSAAWSHLRSLPAFGDNASGCPLPGSCRIGADHVDPGCGHQIPNLHDGYWRARLGKKQHSRTLEEPSVPPRGGSSICLCRRTGGILELLHTVHSVLHS